jgi:hypothetical protein
MEIEKLASIFEACRVLPLRPTDMLVFRSTQKLSVEEMALCHLHLEQETGHSRILILTDGADLAVLRPEEDPVSAVAAPIGEPQGPIVKTGKAPGAIA